MDEQPLSKRRRLNYTSPVKSPLKESTIEHVLNDQIRILKGYNSDDKSIDKQIKKWKSAARQAIDILYPTIKDKYSNDHSVKDQKINKLNDEIGNKERILQNGDDVMGKTEKILMNKEINVLRDKVVDIQEDDDQEFTMVKLLDLMNIDYGLIGWNKDDQTWDDDDDDDDDG